MLNYSVMEEYGIDYKKSIQRFGGKEALFEKYLFRFPEEEYFGNAIKAYEEGDFTVLLEMTHALKGIVGIIGMEDLHRITSEIVKAIRAENREALAPIIDQMKASYAKACEAVAAMK